MAQENIDVVVRSSGTRRVVVDINAIGTAAIDAQRRLDSMMQTLQNLAGGGLIGNLRGLQSVLNSLASTNLNRLQAQIQALTQQTAALNNAATRAGGGFNFLGNGALGALTGLRNAISGVIAALAVRQLAQWADAWTEAAGKINIFAKSQDEANVVMERIYTIAQTARQPLQSIADLYHRLTISGADLGATQNQMLQVTEIVGKALAVQGTSAAKARGGLLQLSQAFGQARVRAQEFNSMTDSMPILLKVAANHIDGAGGSVSKLRQIMLAGKLSNKQFFDAILKSAGEMDAMFARSGKTFSGAWTVLINGLERFLGQMNANLGISNKFYQLTSFIATNLDTIAKLALVAGIALLAAFTPAGIMGMVGAMGRLLPMLGAAIALLNANPFAVLVTAAAAAYAFGDNLNVGIDGVTTLKDLMIALGITLADTFGSIKEVAGSVWTAIVDFAQEAYNVITHKTSEATTLWSDEYKQFYTDTGTGLSGFFMALAKTADAIGGLILGLGIGLVRVFEGLPDAFKEIGKGMYNGMVEQIEKIVNIAIYGVNKLRDLTGMQLLEPLKLERMTVDEKYFERYGQRIAGALDEGFDMQGNYLQGKLKNLFQTAQTVAEGRRLGQRGSGNVNLDLPVGTPNTATAVDKGAARRAATDAMADIREQLDKYRADAAALTETARHKEALLKDSYEQGLINYRDYTSQLTALQNESYLQQKNLLDQEKSLLVGKLATLKAALRAKGTSEGGIDSATSDITTKIQALDQALIKLNNNNEERLNDALTKALSPAVALVRTSERELELANLNVEQEFKKIAAKTNSLGLSERDQFIQEKLLSITDKYEDKIAKILEIRREMQTSGAFDDMSNPAVKKAWDDMNTALGKWQEALARIRQDAPAALGKAFDAAEIDRFAKELNKALVDALFSGGKDGAKAIRQAITNELKKPFVTLVQSVLQPVTQGISQLLIGGVQSILGGSAGGGDLLGTGGGVAGAAGGVGGLGSLVSGVGSVAGIGAGIATAYTAGSTSVGVMAGSVAGAGGVMGGAAAALGAIPVVGWIALAALAAYAIFGGKGGGPKSEGSFGLGVQNFPRQDPQVKEAAQIGVNALQDQYDKIVEALGAKSIARFGMSISMDPKGKSPTFLGVSTGDLSGNILGSRYSTGIGRSEEDLKAAMAEFSNQMLLRALQHSNIEGAVGEYLRALGDTTLLSASQAAQAIYDVNKAQELQTAITETTANTIERFNAAIDNLRQGIQSFIDQLDATEAGELSKFDQLKNARDQFERQLGLARGGDTNAISGITNYASQLIDASKGYFGSGSGDTASIIDYIKAQLTMLPNQLSSNTGLRDQLVQDAITSTGLSVSGTQAELSNLMGSSFVTATPPAVAEGGSDLSDQMAALSAKFDALITVSATGFRQSIDQMATVAENTGSAADAALLSTSRSQSRA